MSKLENGVFHGAVEINYWEKSLEGKDAPGSAGDRLASSSSAAAVVTTTSNSDSNKSRERADSGCCEDVGAAQVDDMPEPKELLSAQPDDEELALDLDFIPDEALEYARRELGETDEVKCQTIHELREMIYERGECMPHRMDDDFLLRFLRARNFNVNRAHRLIVRYYTFKEEHPEIHQDVNPVEMRHIGDDDIMTVPAYRTPCGRRMMIYRMGNWDPRKYSVEEIFKATVIILELGLLEPRAQILGGIVIFDLEGITMTHAWTITPQVASMVLSLMVAAFPMTTHAIHILHQSWIFDTMFAVFKPLIDSKMNAKIFFHGSDMESLHRHVPPEYLPKKYGGTREELPYYRWIESLGKDPRVVKEMKGLGYVIPDEICKNDKDD
ncbi:alpha-tocopherol transfer protein isoform X2 [Nasonia vitripennis]|uniref:CRAL-TRIO domain-containing protein n=1 Tax=Nasonia vitripennis TaxID=7425 RepID=A0A7M7QVY9_NASVI|nr:alpha-tocopherol transfer protein isoform X2 [Nasonia vitripennis]XP_032454788.1 alpha-tocopherol transfer protein isoform X2 [Nasonia vitripennis]